MTSPIKEVWFRSIGELLYLCRLKQVRIFSESLCCHLIRKVGIDVRYVSLAFDLGHERRCNLPRQQIIKVEPFKERMRHDLIDIEPLLRISCKQSS